MTTAGLFLAITPATEILSGHPAHARTKRRADDGLVAESPSWSGGQAKGDEIPDGLSPRPVRNHDLLN
jgi:hypothetical protein